MKKALAIAVVISLVVVTGLFAQNGRAVGRDNAPGQAENFYRGVTTLDPVLTTNITTSTSTETRMIGSGQNNNNKDGNLQDRTVTVTTIEVVSVTESHRGAPNSNGVALEPVVEVISSDTTTEVGDWGSAYSVPSGTK